MAAGSVSRRSALEYWIRNRYTSKFIILFLPFEFGFRIRTRIKWVRILGSGFVTVQFEFRFFFAWFLVQDPDPSQVGSNPGFRIRNGHNSKFFSLFLPFGFEFRDPDPIQVDPNPEFRSVTVLFLKFSILVPGIQD